MDALVTLDDAASEFCPKYFNFTEKTQRIVAKHWGRQAERYKTLCELHPSFTLPRHVARAFFTGATWATIRAEVAEMHQDWIDTARENAKDAMEQVVAAMEADDLD